MRILFFSILVFSFFNCSKKEVIPTVQNPPIVKPTPTLPGIKYLALGDSYTIGQSVLTEDRYPIQFASQLEMDSIKVDTTIIIAQTGWTTTNLKNAIVNANLTDTFELVSLLIGVNNQYQNKPLSQYKIEFKELLQTAIDFAGGDKEHVFVISIPDYAYTPFGNGNPTISQEIDAFNFANKTITDSTGVSYFDITPISRDGLTNTDLVADDGLHPSGTQYSLWVDLFFDAVKMKVKQ